MRITDTMLTNRVLFNTQRSLQRFFDLETNMSSGRRINKPSDDPTGTLRDLNYREELAKIAQNTENVNQALNWSMTYDNILQDLNNFTSSVKEIAVAMSNGTYDDAARAASASEVQSIFESIIRLANSELDDRKMFSGFRTKTTPLATTSQGVVYNGDMGEMQFEIESSLRMTVNLTGSDVFFTQLKNLGDDADLNVAVTSDTLIENLHNGEGIDLATGSFVVTDINTNNSVTIDLNAGAPVTTIDELLTRINTDLAAGVPPINNLTAVLGDEGNNIKFVPTATGEVSTFTELTMLNGGSGVDLNPGTINITDGGGIDLNIDLSGAVTLGDVINEFNNQLSASGIPGLNNVVMSINATGTGLQIDDNNGLPLGLNIYETDPRYTTAGDLGILGAVGGSLVGTDLNPQVHFEITENGGSTAADLGVFGDFSSDFVGNDLDPSLTLDANLADLRNGNGIDMGQLLITQGDISYTLDLTDPTIVTLQDIIDTLDTSGLDVTVEMNENGRGLRIVNNDQTKSFTIKEVGNGRSARDMGLYGSSDLLGTMLVLTDALNGDDQEGTGMLLENLDLAIDHILKYRGVVGARTTRLNSTESRLQDMQLNFTKLLSEVEDADMTELVTQLATYENNYQASLIASSKIVQPSLLYFLD